MSVPKQNKNCPNAANSSRCRRRSRIELPPFATTFSCPPSAGMVLMCGAGGADGDDGCGGDLRRGMLLVCGGGGSRNLSCAVKYLLLAHPAAKLVSSADN